MTSWRIAGRQAKNQPIRLNSWEPPPARLYAWRQMELMRQGVGRRRAQRMVQAEYEAEVARKCGPCLGAGRVCMLYCMHNTDVSDAHLMPCDAGVLGSCR